MQSLHLLSSSDAARQAAAAWLAAFDAALAAGLAEDEAHARAGEAWRLAVGRESGTPADQAGILAVQPWIDARPPPLPVG
jgi:hypothetical protein